MDANLLSILTGTTCGFACWQAQEDVCRCSCGGKNHGIMAHGGAQPERTAKISGKVYQLAAVGAQFEISRKAFDYNWYGDYNAGRLRRDTAEYKPATLAQKKWPEVVNSGIDYPYLLWIPV